MLPLPPHHLNSVFKTPTLYIIQTLSKGGNKRIGSNRIDIADIFLFPPNGRYRVLCGIVCSHLRFRFIPLFAAFPRTAAHVRHLPEQPFASIPPP